MVYVLFPLPEWAIHFTTEQLEDYFWAPHWRCCRCNFLHSVNYGIDCVSCDHGRRCEGCPDEHVLTKRWISDPPPPTYGGPSNQNEGSGHGSNHAGRSRQDDSHSSRNDNGHERSHGSSSRHDDSHSSRTSDGHRHSHGSSSKHKESHSSRNNDGHSSSSKHRESHSSHEHGHRRKR